MDYIFNFCKTVVTVTLLAVSALCFVSCDRDADKVEIETFDGWYVGEFQVSLYVPEREIEVLDSCTVPQMGYDSLNVQFLDNATKVAFSMKNFEDIRFNLPYLDENGEVLPVYQDGVFADLYNMLKDAVAKGDLEQDVFETFKSEIDTLRDVLVVSDISFSPIPIEEDGALLVSFNPEEMVHFTPITMNPAVYTRKSNVFTALKYLEPVLTKWAKEGKLSAEIIEDLRKIEKQQSNTIEDGSGMCLCGYSNFYFDIDCRLKKATNLLDNVSLALFGKNSEGKPNKEVWLLLRFKGVLDGMQVFL